MKVLFVSGDYPTNKSNASIFTHNQAKALQNKGIDVRVLEIDMRSIRRMRKWGYKKDEYDGIIVYRMAVPCGPIPLLLDVLSPLAGEYAFKKILKDWGKPDVLHTHFSATSLPAVRIKKHYNLPLVLTEHGSGFVSKSTPNRDKELFVQCASRADRTIAVGTALQVELKKLTRMQIKVIPNVIPASFFNAVGNKSEVFTFVSVGYLIERKRFDLTISCFAKLVENGYDVKLIIAGSGKLEDTLKELVKKSQLEDKITFCGNIANKQLPKMYASCHCFVLPSMSETFGVVYAEAIACGIPVIATRCGGPEDIVNENNGVLIATDSEDELYEAMKLMVLQASSYDPQLMSNDIKNRFGEDVVASQLISVYNQVLENQ